MSRPDDKKPKMGGLARRLIVFILLFSSFITLLGTSLQLYLDYAIDMNAIETAMEQIKKSQQQTIVNNLWVADIEQLHVQLQGILALPDMQYVAITQHGETLLSAGMPPGDQVVSRAYPLNYSFKGQDVDLGVLHVYANLKGVYLRLYDKVFVILVTQTIKTFLVAFFIFSLFYALVGRHLEKLAGYTKGLTLDNLDAAISLDRKKGKATPPDELDTVVNAINDMRTNLISDIEARMQAQKAHRESEKLFSTVIEGTTDAIFAKDLKGRYILLNKATAIAIGVPRDEILGKTDNELFPQKSATIINEVDAHVIESGSPYLAEERLETPLGDTYWLANKSPLIDEDGRVIGIIGISRDITAQKRVEEEKRLLEERLRQTQKMEAIGTLAGGIAHDFNNILAAILGYADMARDKMPEGSQIRYYLDQIFKAGNRAKELVRQILTFSRKGQETPQPLRPSPIIKEALKLMRASLPTTIDIHEQIDPESGFILANPTSIHQVVVNLCTNAFHAMENEKGELTVKLTRVVLTADDAARGTGVSAGAFVELLVKDTGCGMDKATVARIFEPYFTTKEIGKGSGMGLALVHGIVQGYGGFITVESEPGRGSTFHVYFPVIAENPADIEEEKSGPLPKGHERVLAVDDEEVIVGIYKATLERLGYTVTAHSSSEMALAAFRSAPDSFDLVLTDQTMPHLPGSELAKAILQIRPDLPIVLCTGYSSMISKENAEEIGIRRFVMKPLSPRELATTVRGVLDEGKTTAG